MHEKPQDQCKTRQMVHGLKKIRTKRVKRVNLKGKLAKREWVTFFRFSYQFVSVRYLCEATAVLMEGLDIVSSSKTVNAPVFYYSRS